jgi:hypothetical protein
VEEEIRAEDREHLSALSIGHFILAGISLFSGLPALAWGVAGATLVDQVGGDVAAALGEISGQSGADTLGSEAMLEDFEKLVLVTIVGGIVLSVAVAVQLGLVGVKIKQRQWWLFCYLTGWGECLMFPFGTILGIFTILVLGRPSVKKLFGVD